MSYKNTEDAAHRANTPGSKRSKPERNAALFADYRAGLSRSEVAQKYGLAVGSVGTLLGRHGVKLPPTERQERYRRPVKTQPVGRKRVWPDCPSHLRREYDALRRLVPSSQARAALEKEEY